MNQNGFVSQKHQKKDEQKRVHQVWEQSCLFSLLKQTKNRLGVLLLSVVRNQSEQSHSCSQKTINVFFYLSVYSTLSSR